MVQKRPPSLTSLADAYKNFDRQTGPMEVMGIVTDMLPVSRSSTGDYMCTFTLQDPDMSKIYSPTKGLKTRFFANKAEDLPQIKSLGDVILMRQCKVMNIRNAPTILNQKLRTSTVVFPVATIPEEAFKQAYAGGREVECIPQPPSCPRPTMVEQMYAISLKEECSHLLDTGPPLNAPTGPRLNRSGPPSQAPFRPPPTRSGPPAPVRDKFSLINKVTRDQFYDLAVEVVKKFPNRYGYVELYVTDYTTNNMLFDYPSPDEKGEEDDYGVDGDPHGYTNYMPTKRREWPGPYGQRVLMLELLGCHAEFADSRVNENDMVLLQNVRIKLSKDNKLEGNMYPDKRYPNKISVHILKDMSKPEMKQLINRKNDYWEVIERKRKATDPDTRSLKKQKKNNKKKNKSKGANAAAQREVEAVVTENKYVRCMNNDVELSTLTNMIEMNRMYTFPSGVTKQLPFINHCRRVKVRVVDFFPGTLEEFARPVDSTAAKLPDDETYMDIEEAPTQKWNWDFYLLVEDANTPQRQLNKGLAQSWVHVRHEDAEFLLSMEDDATDLSQDSQVLAKLREKFAILWGNLEERKTAATLNNQPYPSDPVNTEWRYTEDPGRYAEDTELSNLPFECCLKEYGQPLDELDTETGMSYIRIHGMFGTRIL